MAEPLTPVCPGLDAAGDTEETRAPLLLHKGGKKMKPSWKSAMACFLALVLAAMLCAGCGDDNEEDGAAGLVTIPILGKI